MTVSWPEALGGGKGRNYLTGNGLGDWILMGVDCIDLSQLASVTGLRMSRCEYH